MNENFWWWLCNVKVNEEICCRETSKVFVCLCCSLCVLYGFLCESYVRSEFWDEKKGRILSNALLIIRETFPLYFIFFCSVFALFLCGVRVYLYDWLTLYFTLSSFREELVEWAFDEDEKKRRRNGKWIHNSTRNKDD